MSVTIRKPADSRYVKCLCFAPAGAGKTVFMGTAQEDERTTPMLILDFEGGTESLSGLDVDVAPIHSWDDYNFIYEALANGDTIDGVDYSRYKSIGIDSISETHKFALLDILAKEGKSRKEPDALQQQDYGKATVQMRRLLREFRDLPLHVFFTAHAKEVEIPREGRVRVPDLAGQMAEEVSGLVSVQGYLATFEEDGELHRTLLLQGIPKFRIKCRTPWGVAAPEEIIDPTVSTLLDVLEIGEASGRERAQGSSRDKRIQDEVPEDAPDRLPGESGDDDIDDEVVKVEAETSDEAVQDVGASSPIPTVTPEELGKMTLRGLKEFAVKFDIDLGDARTRGKARDAIVAALA